jgi:predicted RNA binding protein YcfA (HicA-like mRNA interferase family)
VLTREGFVATHQRGSHRYYKSPITGKIVTSVPMHPGDLNRSLLKKILKQVGWSEEQFRKLEPIFNGNDVPVHVILAVEKNRQTGEIIVRWLDHTLTAVRAATSP